MIEKLTKCPLCSSGHFIEYTTIQDFSISKENFKLYQCKTCNLIFTNPRPNQQSIGNYYEFDEYISHQDQANNLTNWLYKQVRKITLKQKVYWINTFCRNKGNLLDYGCGTGYFLKAANKDGWKVKGIEPNETARNIARKLSIDVKENLSQIDGNYKFDIITLFHVLEHVHDLNEISLSLRDRLTEKGTLLIAVPNRDSWDAEKYKANWAAWDVPRHLYHFNQSTLNTFADMLNMKIISIIPMKFDSYYVSLLSENHLGNTGIKALINGFINGLKSNYWAKRNKKNYSSNLFILKKK
ncbi:2-polyprenyl-3-methyl-5-hydroxy-6-metoxy-1,4-benzoquinol methylase [Belliella buryatensis]|uniref:2-polyprenyl-3-methyl-5-hydroxy-6-metoxy-1,4-benzoquinol methylase n=1 Tax=Belliella buryatensis TaxID=1500549 RepID=A0A239EG05_9BACT|nr:class I SAM-dependent methyltransferase [Belliella buryatensis]SNS42834.1 2-polyprenyl-3-methyl-5-hydroxy-6-metoxy-1,4-benzoquinol methylase [Belliella buryatensis]